MDFKLVSKFKPKGDQPKAIDKLTKNIRTGVKNQVLLGVTGSGKTATMSWVVEKIQKPVLVISPNKTLAAQLYQEFKEFFPDNAVHYFVSYYDYYQPEAYIPQTDTYIEKDARVNEDIDRLRHAAVQSILERKDIIIVASVSCIYNIGSPVAYQKISLEISSGQQIKRREFVSYLSALQYERNDIEFKPGIFHVRGDTIEVFTVTGQEIVKIEFFGDKIDRISLSKKKIPSYKFYPAQFWVAPQNNLNIALENIKGELQQRLEILKKQNKLLEAQRLEQRTNYDIEILKESGHCHGIENYSRHLEFREPGTPPFTLLDYFNYSHHSNVIRRLASRFIVFIDESHITVPQLHAMYNTDKARKEILIEHGFRLPSALDNRPLDFKEFENMANKNAQIVYVSATPGPYEKKVSKKNIIEQLVRPTGLLEPSIEIRPTKGQINNLIAEIKKNTSKKQRALVVTLTKRLAEEIADYFQKEGIKTQYLHSEIKTLERPGILEKLRRGEYEVLVGINLLREGLDLPEVSLIAILDADKEGFLRNKTTLIQTMGRASRHPEGRIILYADKTTLSMKEAIKEIERRRKIQQEYNKKKRITPKAIVKEIREWTLGRKEQNYASDLWIVKDIKILEKEMKTAAQNLDFERAAEIRDLIKKLNL